MNTQNQKDNLDDLQHDRDEEMESINQSQGFLVLDQNQQKIAKELLEDNEEIQRSKEDELNEEEIKQKLNGEKQQDNQYISSKKENFLEYQSHVASEFAKKEKDMEEFLSNIKETNPTNPSEVDKLRYIVNILDLAKQGTLLPWAYAIENNLMKADSKLDGSSLLHIATQYQQLDIIVALVSKHNVDVNQIETKNGQTALMLACLRGDISTIKFLIQSGADLNIQDKEENTALMHAIINRRLFIAIYLVSVGADYQALNKLGQNIAHLAAINDDVEMLQLIHSIDPNLLNQIERQSKLAPAGVAIVEDAHLAYQYLMSVKPLEISKGANYSSLQNQYMQHLIVHDQKKQHLPFLSKEYIVNLYQQKPKDLCILLYSFLICILYYSFVLQTGVLYNKSENLHLFCNIVHFLTIVLISVVFLFSLKVDCPSVKLKQQSMRSTNLDFGIFSKNIVTYNRSQETSYIGDSEGELQMIGINANMKEFDFINKIKEQKNKGLNLFHYVHLLVQQNKFQLFKQLHSNNFCIECLDLKPPRLYHCDQIKVCVPNYSHFSFVFDKLIIKGVNTSYLVFILLLQWSLIVLFFISNYLFCLNQHEFKGYLIFAPIEIPFLYYQHSENKLLAAYIVAIILFYLSSVFLIIEVLCLILGITRFELFNPNRCNVFYPKENIQQLNFSSSRISKESNYFRFYSNPFGLLKCKQ